jgi:AraC-like DNA-binding protein
VKYVERKPGAPLLGLVEHFWCLNDAPDHARERIVPTGNVELVINLHDDEFRLFDFEGRERRFRGAIVSGCYTRAFEFDTVAHASVIGVHFKAGGVARLFGTTAGSLADSHVGLDDLWGHAAIDLREQLCEAGTERERFQVLEHALVSHSSRQPQCRDAARVAIEELNRPDARVAPVARMVGLSHRRFIETFTEDVGMTPKRYSTVQRFQRALAAANRMRHVDWTKIAFEHGYFDQAHLCRDWMHLTGLSPAQLMGARDIPVKANHVALRADG